MNQKRMPQKFRTYQIQIKEISEIQSPPDYASVGHVRFDKGEAMRVVPQLYFSKRQVSEVLVPATVSSVFS